MKGRVRWTTLVQTSTGIVVTCINLYLPDLISESQQEYIPIAISL